MSSFTHLVDRIELECSDKIATVAMVEDAIDSVSVGGGTLPVGMAVWTAVNTNPATLLGYGLGYGTWTSTAASAQLKVIIGISSLWVCTRTA